MTDDDIAGIVTLLSEQATKVQIEQVFKRLTAIEDHVNEIRYMQWWFIIGAVAFLIFRYWH